MISEPASESNFNQHSPLRGINHKRWLIVNSKVLIIEDNEVNRLILKQVLTNCGFKRLREAVNGKEGLREAIDWRPDLIIMDMMMPEMDGFECCRTIRVTPEIADVPILVQTGLSNAKEKKKIFEAGATDYVIKPVDTDEMAARAIIHLEREHMVRELRSYNKRVQEELEMAQKSQYVLMPSDEDVSSIARDYDMLVFHHFQTSSEIGGDFWDIIPLSKHELAICLVDFSGHGVSAALNTFRLHTLMESSIALAKKPDAYVTHLNALIVPLLPTGQYCTMFYGVIDTDEDTLSYVTAAQPSPVILRNDGEKTEFIDGSGMPVGIEKDAIYKTVTIPFKKKDMLFLYSDALTETENDAKQYFDKKIFSERFRQLIGAHGIKDDGMAFAMLLKDFYSEYGENLEDDLTICACYRKG